MKKQIVYSQLSLYLFLAFVAMMWGVGTETAVAQASFPYARNLRISQVYGGGGNSGAPYTHDFIEIFNSGSAPISLNGLSLQYASATGTGNFGASTAQLTELPNVTLGAGQYYLVQQASGGSAGSPLPTPDHIDSSPINLSATDGKVALVTGTTSLGCNGGSMACNAAQLARIIDLVGYGNANFYEGSSAAPTLSNTTAALRNVGGCQDTDNNNADFSSGAPAPRNTASSLNSCVSYTTITLDGNITEAEWRRGLLGTANGTTFGITWDDDFWYFGVRGGFGSADFFMIGIDIDPTNETTNTGGGSTADRCGAVFPDENKPDYILVNRQSSYIRESWGWNGSAWDQNAFNPAEPGDYDFSGAGGHYEVKLRKSAVFASNEDTSPVGFYLWLSNSSCQFFNAWPPENPNGFHPGTRFLYAHTRFATTDANRAPDTYGSRVGWFTHNLAANSTTYNFFGEDDASTNPWLRMTTTASGAGGAGCTVRAKMVGNHSFSNVPFTGVDRYVDFTLTNCTGLEVDVQMRYETVELNGINEANTAFYRCAALPCAPNWTVVSAGSYTRNELNNNLLLANVPQSQFSFWTISDGSTPTAVSLSTFSANSATLPWLLLMVLALLLGSTAVAWRRR